MPLKDNSATMSMEWYQTCISMSLEYRNGNRLQRMHENQTRYSMHARVCMVRCNRPGESMKSLYAKSGCFVSRNGTRLVRQNLGVLDVHVQLGPDTLTS